jgi:hypothetical protein
VSRSAAPHRPTVVEEVPSLECDEGAIFQTGEDASMGHHRLPVTGCADGHVSARLTIQGVQTHEAPVPGSDQHTAVRHRGRCREGSWGHPLAGVVKVGRVFPSCV